jgi:hypothetical protein
MAALLYVIEDVFEVLQVKFEFCSDLRSELAWTPNAEEVEKLTDGPVEVGAASTTLAQQGSG